MKKLGKALGAIAIAGAVVAGGSAFTASSSLPASSVTQGYGAQTITGVTAQTVAYQLNTAKSNIDHVHLVLTGDTTALTIQIAFNDAAPATCSGAGDNTTDNSVTDYVCDVNQQVETAVKFAVIAES